MIKLIELHLRHTGNDQAKTSAILEYMPARAEGRVSDVLSFFMELYEISTIR